MYNVGDRVEFINLEATSWDGAHGTLERIDGNTYWFRRDDGITGNLMKGSLEHYTKLLYPLSLENK